MSDAERELLMALAHAVRPGQPGIKALIEKVEAEDEPAEDEPQSEPQGDDGYTG